MKLHLACGTRRPVGTEDFIHVDIRPEVSPTVVLDITNLNGHFQDGSIELIYWCHGLEHVPRPEVVPTLQKLRALLVDGGVLRLSLPDFRTLAELYVLHGLRLNKVIGPIVGRQDYPENTHYCVYDIESVIDVLRQAGFSRVWQYNPRKVWPEGFDDYSLAEMDGQMISLNVEAKR